MDRFPVPEERRRRFESIIRFIDLIAYAAVFGGGIYALMATPGTVAAELHGAMWLVGVWSGLLCIGGAVGFEIVERWLKDSSYRPRGFPIVDYPVVPEEFLEVLGPALLLLCFMRIQESERVASPS